MTRYTFRKNNLKGQFLTVKQYAKKSGKDSKKVLQKLEKEYAAIGTEVSGDVNYYGKDGEICVITCKNKIVEYRILDKDFEYPSDVDPDWDKICRQSLAVKTPKQIAEEAKIVAKKRAEWEAKKPKWTPIDEYVIYSEDLDVNTIENVRAIELDIITNKKTGCPDVDYEPVLERFAKKIDEHTATDKEFLFWLLTYYSQVKAYALYESFDQVALDIFHQGYKDSSDLFKKIQKYITAETEYLNYMRLF